jgi:hypothetical protein
MSETAPGGSSTAHRTVIAGVACGALVGLIVGLRVLDPQFIAGTGGKWVRPENDYIAYLVAWNYYIVDAWRFPVFALPAMGYPEGGSVLFNDALPLTALITKALYHATGVRVNPFGWWILLTYVLQGAMAARVVCAVGVRSSWACAAGAVLAVVNVAFTSRMGHTALSSHFLLLWAIALYFESLRRGRARALEIVASLAVTLLINAYLFAMVVAIAFVSVAALGFRRQLRPRDLGILSAGTLLVGVLGLVAGYGVLVVNPSAMKSEGFGLYSWNLTGLLLPPNGPFAVLADFPRYGTHGQYEGEAYIGGGALGLFLLCVLVMPAQIVQHLRRHASYVAMLAVLACFAASNVVYAGDRLVLEYRLPAFVVDLANYFRASGRFIWPLAYSLTVLPIALIFRSWRPAAALTAATIAVMLQVTEAAGDLRYRRTLTRQAYEDLIDEPQMRGWLKQHERLWQYPSWSCGGLVPARRWPSPDANRELQLQLEASKAGIPTNSVYTSRVLKNCVVEAEWLTQPSLETGVLYVLAPHAVKASPSLADLVRSDACVALAWATVCSRNLPAPNTFDRGSTPATPR